MNHSPEHGGALYFWDGGLKEEYGGKRRLVGPSQACKTHELPGIWRYRAPQDCSLSLAKVLGTGVTSSGVS